MEDITEGIIQNAIDEMDPIFDSHKIISWIMKNNPQEYTKELYRCVNAKDPIRELNRQIGSALNKFNLIQLGDQNSPNVRGSDTPNMQWKKP